MLKCVIYHGVAEVSHGPHLGWTLFLTGNLQVVVIALFFFTQSGTEGAAFLSSEVSGTSVDLDNPCPEDRLVYTCTTTDGVLTWSVGVVTVGAFIGSQDDVGETRTPAALPGVEANLTAEDGMVLTSTLTIPSAGSVVANESTISCVDLGANINSTVLHIIGTPTAPDITIFSESRRTMDNITVRANLQQPVYGSECIQNYTVIARANGEGDVRIVSTAPDDLFVLVPGLSVCPRRYTFTSLACSPGLPCSGESAPQTFTIADGLLPVTSVASDGDDLRWNPPQNAPPGCITSYTVTWDSGMFTTPDNMTSIPIDNIPGLEVCQTYTSITVTPMVPPFGVIESSSGERRNVALIPSGTLLEIHIPSPSSLQVDMFTYNVSGIAVRLHWNVTSRNQINTVNVSVSYSRSMDTCSRSGPVVPVQDISTTTEMLLDDSFIGGASSFCVFYTFNDCEMRSDTNMSFPLIISGQPAVEQVDRNATFAITFATTESSSIVFDVVSTAVVELEVTPVQESAACSRRNTTVFPADFPNVRTTQILITNLSPGTDYQYTVRVLTSSASNAVEIPRAVTGTFTTDPEFTGGLTIGAAVAISVILSSIVSFSAGALLATLITYYCVRGREKSSGQTCPPSSGPSQPPPVYAEVKPGPVGKMEMKECIAYAPPGPVDTMEMKECVAYNPVGH